MHVVIGSVEDRVLEARVVQTQYAAIAIRSGNE